MEKVQRGRETRGTFGKAPFGRLKPGAPPRREGAACVAARRFACYDAVEFIDAGLSAGRGMTKPPFRSSSEACIKHCALIFAQAHAAAYFVHDGLRWRGFAAPLGLALRSARRALQTCRERRAQKFRPASRRSVERSGAVLSLYIDSDVSFARLRRFALCRVLHGGSRLGAPRAEDERRGGDQHAGDYRVDRADDSGRGYAGD